VARFHLLSEVICFFLYLSLPLYGAGENIQLRVTNPFELLMSFLLVLSFGLFKNNETEIPDPLRVGMAIA
jgi:hypothetical protein